MRTLALALAFALAVVPRVAHAEPDCKGFSGMVFGESTCVAYDLHAKRVVPSKRRVMRAEHPAEAGCDADLVLGKVTMHVVCDVKEAKNPDDSKVLVSIRLADGTSVQLDLHRKAYDWIHVWAKQDDAVIRFTIDYAIEG
jgi:hypothetical protein